MRSYKFVPANQASIRATRIKTQNADQMVVTEGNDQTMMDPGDFVDQYRPSGGKARELFVSLCEDNGIAVPEDVKTD